MLHVATPLIKKQDNAYGKAKQKGSSEGKQLIIVHTIPETDQI